MLCVVVVPLPPLKHTHPGDSIPFQGANLAFRVSRKPFLLSFRPCCSPIPPPKKKKKGRKNSFPHQKKGQCTFQSERPSCGQMGVIYQKSRKPPAHISYLCFLCRFLEHPRSAVNGPRDGLVFCGLGAIARSRPRPRGLLISPVDGIRRGLLEPDDD